MKEILEFSYTFLDIILLHYYCTIFLKRRNLTKVSYTIVFITTVLLVHGVTTSDRYTNAGTVIGNLIIFGYGLVLFRGNILHRIGIVFAYVVVTGLSTLAVTSSALLIPSISQIDLFENLFIRSGVVISIKTLVLFTGLVVRRVLNIKQDTLNLNKFLLYLSILFIILILLFDFLFLNSLIPKKWFAILMSLIFVIGVSILTFLLYKYFDIKDKNRKTEMQLHEALLKNQVYIQNAQQQLELSKLKHDLKNHLITLDSQIKGNRNQDAIEYLEKLFVLPSLKTYVQSNNEIVNAIINYKIAERPDVKLRVNYDAGAYNVPSDKMTIILGNALDNAIEAVSLLPKKQREIEINLFEGDHFINIVMSNRFFKKPIIIDNDLMSSKGKNRIGIGMRNIRETVSILDGIVNVEITDTIFKLTIQIKKDAT